MSSKTPKVFYIIVGVGLFIQAYYFWQYTFGNISLYNRPESTLFTDYTIFHSRIYSWLPMLYNVNIAFKYLPNLGWLIALCSLTGAGVIVSNRSLFPTANFLGRVGAFCVVVIFVSGSIFNAYGYKALNSVTYLGKDLPSNSGRVEGTARVAIEGVDKPGALNFRPYVPLSPGSYRVVVRYQSFAPVAKEVGAFDVPAGMGATITAPVPLWGTGGVINTAAIAFRVSKHQRGENFEFRSQWNGSSDLRVLDIRLERQ